MKQYQARLNEIQSLLALYSKKDNRISSLRLILVITILGALYQYFQSDYFIWIIITFLILVGFFALVIIHKKVRWYIHFLKEKSKINNEEIQFLEGNVSLFDGGHTFKEKDHPYSFDLDFFGDHSLYQWLNRTSTSMGKSQLAKMLLSIQSKQVIIQTQNAIQELATQIDWRQNLLATSRMNPDSSESFDELMDWASQKSNSQNRFTNFIAYLAPIAMVSLIIAYLLGSEIAGRIAGLLFLFNLGILGMYIKAIQKELISTTKIEKILKQYALQLRSIELQSFATEKLQSLQSSLFTKTKQASTSIHKLALLFGRMEHVTNAFASPILNGLFLFHIHTLRQLTRWKMQHASNIKVWLDVLGEIEALNSIANFNYNNPQYVFPTINDSFDIRFEEMGHPLLNKDKAVVNTIGFEDQHFFILTGSNMSGKSTFLRSIGVNMVLAGIGAPVFASKAHVHPMSVFVSMRLSDSLSDSESYFYAEVKRLKAISDFLKKEPCFILLDEILRGTNSDDKREGTIQVIRKMVQLNAYGGIATHDLEVCKTADEFPKQLSNKRFEVEIINDELVFDYRLREGICQNKSASFIMKKMGVI